MSALAGRRGLLDELGLNLRCSHTEDGHKHWAPHPKYWIGRECMAAVGENKRCRRKLRYVPRGER